MTSRKSLTIVCGNAGSGKTTVGRLLAERRRAAFLDIDTVSERLVVSGLKSLKLDADDRDSSVFKSLYRDAIHETLFAIADENLDFVPCVIVAPLTQERRDATFLQTMESRLRCPVQIILTWCADEIRRKRIAQRKNPRDRSKLENWESYSAAGSDPHRPDFAHQFLNTSPDLPLVLRECEELFG